MKTLAAVFFIFVSCNAYAQDWTATDKAMLTGALALLAVDWGQTRDLVRRPAIEDFNEKNPFLPRHPTKHQVDRYFFLAMAGTAGLAYVLPQKKRRWFLGGVIVLETAVVIRNDGLGLRVRF